MLFTSQQPSNKTANPEAQRPFSRAGAFWCLRSKTESLLPPCSVMDLQHEKLARLLGDGHRAIFGAAGLGKNMILGYRAEYCRIGQTCYLHDIHDFDASFMQHHNLLAPLLKLIKVCFAAFSFATYFMFKKDSRSSCFIWPFLKCKGQVPTAAQRLC